MTVTVKRIVSESDKAIVGQVSFDILNEKERERVSESVKSEVWLRPHLDRSRTRTRTHYSNNKQPGGYKSARMVAPGQCQCVKKVNWGQDGRSAGQSTAK